MPGPGPHMIYALGSGQGLMHVSNGRFSPHHCVAYAINAFFGPDIGSFCEWLSSIMGSGRVFGSSVEQWIHDPFYYALILGFPLSLLYSWVSRFLLQKGVLDSFSGENGHSSMYTWILSTGWWSSRAPIYPDAVVVVGLLCATLVGGFIYIYRVKPVKSAGRQHERSLRLTLVVAAAYCLWCASQIYVATPRRPPVGEEADLGVLVFLAVFFFFPHCLCILSMNPREIAEQLPP